MIAGFAANPQSRQNHPGSHVVYRDPKLGHFIRKQFRHSDHTQTKRRREHRPGKYALCRKAHNVDDSSPSRLFHFADNGAAHADGTLEIQFESLLQLFLVELFQTARQAVLRHCTAGRLYGPNADRAAATIASHSSAFVTSTRTARTSEPVLPRISAAVSSSRMASQGPDHHPRAFFRQFRSASSATRLPYWQPAPEQIYLLCPGPSIPDPL